MGDPLPINYHDIIAWSGVTGERLAPWELGAVMALDQKWRAAQRPAD